MFTKLFSTERRCEVATGLVIVALFGFGLGGGELVLRVQQLQRFGKAVTVERSENFVVDQATGLLVPRAGAKFGRIQINSLGFRSPEITAQKGPDTLRIAFLGSSTTFDPMVGNDDMWTHVASTHLRRALSGCNVEFVNAGAPGYGSQAIMKRLTEHVLPLDPDIVVVLAGDVANDANELANAMGLTDRPNQRVSMLAKISILWAKIEKSIAVIRLQRAAHSDVGKLELEPNDLAEEFGERLTELVRTANQTNRLVVLLTQASRVKRTQSKRAQTMASTWLYYMPYLSIPTYLELIDAYNGALRIAAEKQRAVVVDAFESVPADFVHFADATHLTKLGDQIVGG